MTGCLTTSLIFFLRIPRVHRNTIFPKRSFKTILIYISISFFFSVDGNFSYIVAHYAFSPLDYRFAAAVCDDGRMGYVCIYNEFLDHCLMRWQTKRHTKQQNQLTKAPISPNTHTIHKYKKTNRALINQFM